MITDPTLFGTKKSIDHFEVYSKKGKVRLKCDVAERWQNIVDLTLKCGNKAVKRTKRRRGIEVAQINSLETTIGGSLGLKGVAELSSSITGQTSTEYRFEAAIEEEEEFEFAAPDCGSTRILVYQLTRVFEFDFQDTRYLHADAWQREIVEWLPQTRDESKQSKNDPDCGCDMNPDAGVDGLTRVTLDGMRILETYNVVAPGQVHFNRLGTGQKVDANLWPYEFEMDIDADSVPEYLLYLTFQESQTFRARFKPVDLQLPMTDVAVPVPILAG